MASRITATGLGEHLDMSRQRVMQLADDEVFIRDSNGRFDRDGCRIAYLRWLRDDTRRSSKSASQSRVTDARAREIELRVAKEEHKLIDIDEHDAVFDEAFGILKSRLSSVPARATRDVALRKTIEIEIDGALKACSDHFEQAAVELAAAGEAAVPVAEDDA